MVEELLVRTPALADSDRLAGKALLDLLESEGTEVDAAFWLYIDDESVWRLCIATKLADTIGPLEVYGRIRKYLYELTTDERNDLDLSDIAVISPENRIVGDLRHRYGVVRSEDNRRIRRVDGPYIYRLTAE